MTFTRFLAWLVLRARSDTAKKIEILVLRHQLAVLQRRTPRPRMSRADQALTAALTQLLPTRRRLHDNSHRPHRRRSGRLDAPWPPSSRGEFHPPALTDPYVNLSVHTALVVLVTRLWGRSWSRPSAR